VEIVGLPDGISKLPSAFAPIMNRRLQRQITKDFDPK
jgi:hypothetical protein